MSGVGASEWVLGAVCGVWWREQQETRKQQQTGDQHSPKHVGSGGCAEGIIVSSFTLLFSSTSLLSSLSLLAGADGDGGSWRFELSDRC